MPQVCLYRLYDDVISKGREKAGTKDGVFAMALSRKWRLYRMRLVIDCVNVLCVCMELESTTRCINVGTRMANIYLLYFHAGWVSEGIPPEETVLNSPVEEVCPLMARISAI